MKKVPDAVPRNEKLTIVAALDILAVAVHEWTPLRRRAYGVLLRHVKTVK